VVDADEVIGAGDVVDAGAGAAGWAEAGDVVGCVDVGCVGVVFGACATQAAETATNITDNFVQSSFMRDSLGS
jgi:hypothetical protein